MSFAMAEKAGAAKTPEKIGEKPVQIAQATAEKAAAPAEKPPAGQYKIGVVNRKSVLRGYKKVEDEYKKLESEVKTRQEEIDKLSKKIEAAKDAYDKEKDKLSPEERAEREAAIQNDYRQYQAQLQTQQGEIDSKERLLMKKVLTEIDDAVSKIGARENYHIIFEGSSSAGAIYYVPAIDISQQVVDLLNSKL